jgi:hypothetical protein
MARYKNVNGKRIRLTEAEELALEQEEKARMAKRATQRIDGDRKQAYPPIGDQLDAILKQFAMMRLNGQDMNRDLDKIIGQWLQVKKNYPKEER